MSYRKEFRSTKVEWDVPDDLPQVEIDANRFRQVFVNLYTNALDAMGPGGTLTLRTRHNADALRVDVTDSGSGMPAQILDRIFEPFFTTKTSGKGTGLGLSVTHGIVTKHGGSITCTSRPGEGATFTPDFDSSKLFWP
ncbi:MAG: HAMP domain-containing histidine kinase [Actinobacteria bacterium]|nr:HAMP domain-containing histidine kinase [Actinomycetota bacterium]